MRRTLFVIAIVMGACTHAADGVSQQALAGATYYVATDGSDELSCDQAMSPDTPKQTIYEAMRCLSAGDTLLIRGGTYHPQAPNMGGSDNISDHFFGTADDNRITIAAVQGEQVVFSPPDSAEGAYAFDFYSDDPRIASYITWDSIVFDLYPRAAYDDDCTWASDGDYWPICRHMYNAAFRIEGATGSYGIYRNLEIKNIAFAAVLQSIGDHGVFEDNNVHDYVPPDPAFQARFMARNNQPYWMVGMYDYSSYSTYRHNTFRRLGRDGFQYWDTSNPLAPVQGKVFDGNYFIDNGKVVDSDGSVAYDGDPSDALYNGTYSGAIAPIIIVNNVFANNTTVIDGNSANTIFANNTVVGNEKVFRGPGVGPDGSIQNNIFVGNSVLFAFGEGYDPVPPPPGTITNNLCDAECADADGNVLTTDPGFIDGSTGNYALRSDSAAIDKGAQIAAATTDIIDTPRPYGAGYDLGAFEYSPDVVGGGDDQPDGGADDTDPQHHGGCQTAPGAVGFPLTALFGLLMWKRRTRRLRS